MAVMYEVVTRNHKGDPVDIFRIEGKSYDYCLKRFVATFRGQKWMTHYDFFDGLISLIETNRTKFRNDERSETIEVELWPE